MQKKTVPGLAKQQRLHDQAIARETQTDPDVLVKVYSSRELLEELKKIDRRMSFDDERSLTGKRKPLAAQMARRLGELRKAQVAQPNFP